MHKIKISAKGQISIPADLRRRYDLSMGDQLIIRETEQGLVLTPVPEHPLLELRGYLKSKQGKKLTEELLDERKSDREKNNHMRCWRCWKMNRALILLPGLLIGRVLIFILARLIWVRFTTCY